MFWIKAFRTRFDLVVAVCDEEILDKKLHFKNLEIKINRNFYGGQLVDENLVVKILNKATIANLFGKKIVELAEKKGFITKENVIVIDGIPHAQFVKIQI
ncbi:MAG: DUF424 family protein [Candidatus Aenigmatarchaeota archaeon]